MRDLDQFLAALFVEFGNAQADHLTFGCRRKTEVGIDDRGFDRLHHRLIPDLHRQHARFRHADRCHLIERHVAAIGLNLYRLDHGDRGAPGAQSAQFVLERRQRAFHPALEIVDVEIPGGHAMVLL
jgi:hypothetical protein